MFKKKDKEKIPKSGTSAHVMWAKGKRDNAQKVLDKAKQDFKAR